MRSERFAFGVAVVVVGLTLPFAFTACGRFSGEDGPTPADGATPDAPDGSPGDPIDAAADGQSAEIDGACGHTFCESFDKTDDWPDWQRVEGSTSFFAEKTKLISPPNALGARTVGTGAIARAYLHRTFPSASHIVVRAQIAVEQNGAESDLDVISVHLSGSETFDTVVVVYRSGANQVVLEHNDHTGVQASATVAAIRNGFQQVTLDITSKQATLTYDSTPSSIAFQTSPTLAPEWQLRIGTPWFNHSSGSWAVYIDDLTVDTSD